jgi:hypothetical protein
MSGAKPEIEQRQTHLLQLASRSDRKPLIPLTAMAVNSKT